VANSNSHGRFAWYELLTTDIRSAKTFYSQVMGWDVLEASAPGRPYALLAAGDTLVGGLMEMSGEARLSGVGAGWIGYVEVGEVDTVAQRVKRLGGAVHVPPTDVPGISRFCIFADPQAARLGILKWPKPLHGQSPTSRGRHDVPWHELLATNWDEAVDFYVKLFGWQKAETKTSDFGTYQTLSAGGQPIGGIRSKPPAIRAPFWLYYFHVGDLDAATGRLTAAGGHLLDDPFELSGGNWTVPCADPQGAMFALEGKRQKKSAGYFRGARDRKWSW
jgi:predicted enzyme related to lactoylglutathione lyase